VVVGIPLTPVILLLKPVRHGITVSIAALLLCVHPCQQHSRTGCCSCTAKPTCTSGWRCPSRHQYRRYGTETMPPAVQTQEIAAAGPPMPCNRAPPPQSVRINVMTTRNALLAKIQSCDPVHDPTAQGLVGTDISSLLADCLQPAHPQVAALVPVPAHECCRSP
jgi:hypothetical protein